MKGAIYYSLPVKVISGMLSIFACFFCVVGLSAALWFAEAGFYSQQEWSYFQSNDCKAHTYSDANKVVFNYYDIYRQREQFVTTGSGSIASPYDSMRYDINDAAAGLNAFESVRMLDDELSNYADMFSTENTNFLFTLRRDGEIIPISTYEGQTFGYYDEYLFTYYDNWSDKESIISIQCYITDPLTANDRYQESAYWFGKAYEQRYRVIWIAIIGGFILISTSLFLVCSAGKKYGSEGIVVGGLHTIPFDLLTGIVGIMVVFLVAIGFNLNISHIAFTLLFVGILVTIFFGLMLFFVMSMAVRLKAHCLLENTLIYRIFCWIKKRVLGFYRHRSGLWKWVVWVLIGAFITFFVGLVVIKAYLPELWLLYAILATIFISCVGVAYLMRQRRITKGISQIVAGNLNARVDTTGLYGEQKQQAENLNHISAAVQRAVEERLRSERMKTELITNVSHDIKTPLTSIVNYVNLLKEQKVEDATIQEYIEVLDRKSTQLKKLIEDLIDASKVSSGNIPVDLVQLDTTELLKQVSGEYVDRLKNEDLEFMLTVPEEEVPILADGQHLWRVFDNLMSNAQKYSQPGTRIYLDLKEEEGNVVITFRNISRYPLNISGDELMERFVRGDSSRHTEGSGLGLSIARSLTELMNGRFEIIVDGDLFKVQLTFFKLV